MESQEKPPSTADNMGEQPSKTQVETENTSTTADSNEKASNAHVTETAVGSKPENAPSKRSWKFWLCFLCMCMLSFTTALESTIYPTALPTITREIGGEENYVWVGGAFLLASTVVQPFVGQLANVFGRRWPMIIVVCFFLLGSGIAGGADDIGMMIAGRTVQGIGGGGIFVLLDIITCDLVPLRERGKWLGLVLSTGALGATTGPLIGGAIAESQWRWIYYMNLPLAGVCLVALFLFLRVQYTKATSWQVALKRIDYLGGLLFMASVTAVLVALIMGGVTFPWGSWHIIVPLVLGFVGWGAFHYYQSLDIVKEPSVPPHLFRNRTSCVGFILAFLSAVQLVWTITFIPIYFQGVLGTSPTVSGVNTLPFNVFFVPAGIIAGGLMSKTGKYKPFHWLGFGLTAIASGLFSTLDIRSYKAEWAAFEIIDAFGVGWVMITILPAIQASLSDADTASSAALYSFLRGLGYVWGNTIPSIIFNNQTDRFLHLVTDPEIATQLRGGRAYGLVSGGFIQALAPETQDQVRELIASVLRPVWQARIAFGLLGVALTFIEKSLTMRTELDTEYGLEEDKKKTDVETADQNTLENKTETQSD